MSRRLLIAGGGTGGHLMPALAIADIVTEALPDWTVHLVGARRGVEATILPHRPYSYSLLSTEPIYRREWWKNLAWVWMLPRVRRETLALLDRVQPDLVLGTGGYASAPVLFAASRRGVPTAIQEQNAFPGITTRWLARRARHIYLGVPEARRYLRVGAAAAVYDTGNPIAEPDPARRQAALRRFGLVQDKPVLLVSGGSQGALAINRVVAEWLESGEGRQLQVLWSTGAAGYERYAHLHDPPRVSVMGFIDPMADAWSVADFALTRAGMMTIAEALAWGVPLCLVPLPGAAADHQTANAVVVARAGAGVHVEQQEFTVGRLGLEVGKLVEDQSLRLRMRERALARGRPDSARRILAHLQALAP